MENLTVKTLESGNGYYAQVYRNKTLVYEGMLPHENRDKARREALKEFKMFYSWGMVDTSVS